MNAGRHLARHPAPAEEEAVERDGARVTRGQRQGAGLEVGWKAVHRLRRGRGGENGRIAAERPFGVGAPAQDAPVLWAAGRDIDGGARMGRAHGDLRRLLMDCDRRRAAELLGIAEPHDDTAPFEGDQNRDHTPECSAARGDLHHEPPSPTPARSGPTSGSSRSWPALSWTVCERDTHRSATPVSRAATPVPTHTVERRADVLASWS